MELSFFANKLKDDILTLQVFIFFDEEVYLFFCDFCRRLIGTKKQTRGVPKSLYANELGLLS